MTVGTRDEELADLGDAGAPGEPAVAGTRSARPRGRVLALVAVLVAALFLGGSTLVWWRADHDQSLARAQTRDVVVIAARQDVAVLSTLDYRDVAAGLARWRAVSTGQLAKQLGAVDAQAEQALQDAAKVSTGKVVDAALTRLDDGAGTASAIATVEISIRDQAGQTTVKRDRFTLDLVRSHGRWLVSRLDQLPVSLS